jgi:hypothetical protein
VFLAGARRAALGRFGGVGVRCSWSTAAVRTRRQLRVPEIRLDDSASCSA